MAQGDMEETRKRRRRTQKRLYFQAKAGLENLLEHIEAYISGHVEQKRARTYLPDPIYVKTPRMPNLVKLFGLESEYSACQCLLKRQREAAQDMPVAIGVAEGWSVKVNADGEVTIVPLTVDEPKVAGEAEFEVVRSWLNELCWLEEASGQKWINDEDKAWMINYRENLVRDFRSRMNAWFNVLHSLDREEYHDEAMCYRRTCPICGNMEDCAADGSSHRSSLSEGQQPSANGSVITQHGLAGTTTSVATSSLDRQLAESPSGQSLDGSGGRKGYSVAYSEDLVWEIVPKGFESLRGTVRMG